MRPIGGTTVLYMGHCALKIDDNIFHCPDNINSYSSLFNHSNDFFGMVKKKKKSTEKNQIERVRVVSIQRQPLNLETKCIVQTAENT